MIYTADHHAKVTHKTSTLLQRRPDQSVIIVASGIMAPRIPTTQLTFKANVKLTKWKHGEDSSHTSQNSVRPAQVVQELRGPSTEAGHTDFDVYEHHEHDIPDDNGISIQYHATVR